MKKSLVIFALASSFMATKGYADLPAKTIKVSVDQLIQELSKNPKADLNADTTTSAAPVAFDLTIPGKTITAMADPTAFFAAVRAKLPQTTIQTVSSNGKPLTLVSEYGKLSVKGLDKPFVYDYLFDVTDNLLDPTDTEDAAEGPGYVDYTYKILSVTGSIVSYEVAGGSYSPGAAHPNSGDSVNAVDVASIQNDGTPTFSPANLLDLVDQASLLSALKADTFLRSKAGGHTNVRKLLATKTVQQFSDTLNDILLGGDSCLSLSDFQNSITEFAIFDYNSSKNLVQVRLQMDPSADACRGEAEGIQLGLQVKPTAAFEAVLRKQQATRMGLFMKNAAK